MAADDIDFVGESQPRTSPELLGAAETPTFEAAKSTAGMAPHEGSDGELRRGEGLCQGPSLVISDGRLSRHIPSNRHLNCLLKMLRACLAWSRWLIENSSTTSNKFRSPLSRSRTSVGCIVTGMHKLVHLSCYKNICHTTPINKSNTHAHVHVCIYRVAEDLYLESIRNIKNNYTFP